MPEEKSKLIPFSRQLEDAIEADAARCERSFVRQVVAVLKAHYDIDAEISRARLQIVGELHPTAKTKTPLLKSAGKKKKKA